jgi:hypothetical protein
MSTAAYRAAHPEVMAAYRATHKKELAAYMRKYWALHPEAARAKHHAYYLEHREEIHAKNAVYRKEHPEGSAMIRKRHKAVRRSLGFVPMNQPFDGCNGHHIDRERVVYIPEVLHMSIRHNVWNGRNMAKINAIAFNFLFKQEVEAALGETA